MTVGFPVFIFIKIVSLVQVQSLVDSSQREFLTAAPKHCVRHQHCFLFDSISQLKQQCLDLWALKDFMLIFALRIVFRFFFSPPQNLRVL